MQPKGTRILRAAKAGFVDKGDVAVHLKPAAAGSGVQLDIDSKVMSMFGEQIRASVLEIIRRYELTDAVVTVQDKGAWDYVIRARVQTAIERAIKEER
jgi:citrate lyase subunit gamma (acyl carrier protein)